MTQLKRHMKPIPITDFDNILLRKRSILETVHEQLKNLSQIEHPRHHSLAHFMVNLVAALIAYSWQPKKPSLHLHHHDLGPVTV